VRFAALVRTAKAPVIALGGVNRTTAPRLIGTGATGLAAIDGFFQA
jgi:thiamine monophosphate synthase